MMRFKWLGAVDARKLPVKERSSAATGPERGRIHSLRCEQAGAAIPRASEQKNGLSAKPGFKFFSWVSCWSVSVA